MLKMEFESGLSNSVYRSIRLWIDHLQREVEEKRKKFSVVLILLVTKLITTRAIQSHSAENPVDPSLQDNVLIPNDCFEYIYHVGCHINVHSIISLAQHYVSKARYT